MNQGHAKGQRAMYEKLPYKEQIAKRCELFDRMLNAVKRHSPERAMVLGMWFQKWRSRNFSF